MLKHFHIFATSACPYCVEAIGILDGSGHEYVLTLLDKGPEYRNQLKKKWKWDTVPIIITRDVNGEEELIGGCSDLKTLFETQSESMESEDACSLE
jgi:glutaredoxin|tara:strand:+ start:284 stop:571 length:288 start_codon:yes stop_codon:yes gene_type:complete